MNRHCYKFRLHLIVTFYISFFACASNNHGTCNLISLNSSSASGSSNDTATLENIIQVTKNCYIKNCHFESGNYIPRSSKYENLTFSENNNVNLARNNCDFEEWIPISVTEAAVDTIYILEKITPNYVCMWWNSNWSVTIREHHEYINRVSFERYYKVSATPLLSEKERSDFLLKQRITNWNLDELAQMRTPRHVKVEIEYYLLTRLIINHHHISQCEWVHLDSIYAFA